MAANVDKDSCIACGECAENCPMKAIVVDDVACVDEDACIECGACEANCPTGAITI